MYFLIIVFLISAFMNVLFFVGFIQGIKFATNFNNKDIKINSEKKPTRKEKKEEKILDKKIDLINRQNEVMLQNINNYDGFNFGQKDIPNEM